MYATVSLTRHPGVESPAAMLHRNTLRSVLGALSLCAALGCDLAPAPEGEVIELGLVSGKADALLDVELPELPVGGATVVRVTPPDALALTLHRVGGATAQLSAVSRGAGDPSVAESEVDAEPTLALPGSVAAVEHEITIHNRGTEPYRGRLQVEVSAEAGPGSAAPDVARVVVGSNAALASGAFETALADALAGGGTLQAFGYFSDTGAAQPVILLEKAGAWQVVAGGTAALLTELNGLTADGWAARQFEHGNVDVGSPAVVWLRKGTVHRSYVQTIEGVKNRANSMAASGWEVVELLQRGAAAPMVAWLQAADGTIEVEADPDCYAVQDAITARVADGDEVLRLRYGGTADSVAWLRKGESYVPLLADSPGALREDLRVHLQDGFAIETLSYRGSGAIVWLTKGTDVDFVLAADAPGLDAALDGPLSDGWAIHTFIHRGPTAAAAIVTR